jgi:hypothetical protein
MCPGVDSASKNEYQVNPGGKVPMSRNLGALTSWNPVGLFRSVMGHLYFNFTLLREINNNHNTKQNKTAIYF